jgi:hypothetical protein
MPEFPMKTVFRAMCPHRIFAGVVVLGLQTALGFASAPVVSISPFPYDTTQAAAQTVSQIIRDYTRLYTVQLDNGIPWNAALNGLPFDKGMMDQWNRHKAAIGSNLVYLAIAPLAEDRVSWAPNFNKALAPAWASDEQHATPQLKKAYTQYVLRAIDFFHPTFLNLGVEAGDMARRKPSKWPLFEDLFTNCAAQVRARYPEIRLGISFSLPLLMQPGIPGRAAKVIGQSDYVGISFYPYLSDFYAKLGGVALPAPPQQWLSPLTWLERNIKKPVAICETGYSSQPVVLPHYDLSMNGTESLQSEYVTNLAEFAVRDHYLFTVFFLAVDCDALMKQLPVGDGSGTLWTHTGFFNGQLQAKPAWSGYLRAWLGSNAVAAASISRLPSPPDGLRVSAVAADAALAFNSPTGLFSAPAPDRILLVKGSNQAPSMRWEYSYRPHAFSWALKSIPLGSATGSSGLEFDLRSDRPDVLLLQVEQADGGSFFSVLRPSQGWSHQKILWTAFSPDPKKHQSGPIQPDRITRIMLADAAAVDRNASGHRTVDLSNLRCLSDEKNESK